MRIRLLLGLLATCALLATSEAAFAQSSIRAGRAARLGQPFVAEQAQQRSSSVLYDQMDNEGFYSIISVHHKSPGFYNTSGADDFVVPTGETWTVQGVSVRALWYNRVYERVRFFADAGGKPGALIATYPYRRGKATGNLLKMWLGSDGPVLTGGTYWLAVQGNGGYNDFYWTTRTTQSNNPAMWQNPSDSIGTGCTTWAPMAGCAGVPEPDFMFALGGVKGRAATNDSWILMSAPLATVLAGDDRPRMNRGPGLSALREAIHICRVVARASQSRCPIFS